MDAAGSSFCFVTAPAKYKLVSSKSTIETEELFGYFEAQRHDQSTYDDLQEVPNMNSKALIVEFIGTLFLVLTVGLTVICPGAGPFAQLAIGCVLMVMV
jgi:glycerol uptake facilitator-like aquaporin